MDQVGGGFCDNADKGAALIMLERQVFFRDLGNLLHEFLFFVRVFNRFLLRILPDSDIVRSAEIEREQVLLFRHIHAEVIAGVEIVEIQAVGDRLFFDIVEIGFKFPAGEEIADRGISVSFKLFFGEQEVFDFFERSARFVCLPYGRYVVGVSIRQGEFFSVPDKPFTEFFVFPEFFEQRYILRIRAQAIFEHVFGLGEPFVDAQVRNDIPARIMPVGAVFVFGALGDDASVDERGIGIVVFGIGGIPFTVLEPFLNGLQFLREPADAVAVAEIVVFHIADKASSGMYAVDGDLFAAPLFLLFRNGNGHFHEFLFPNGETRNIGKVKM